VLETTILRRRDRESTSDRGTKQILVVSVLAGFAAAWLIARDAPSLRLGANTWATLVLGAAVALAGAALRVWAVWSLGRFFRRDVTFEAGQTIHRNGPYRVVRHPAYTGNLLTYFGLGLGLGSCVGALACLAIALAGHLPRMRVEEAALVRGLVDAYRDYARATPRLVPRLR
jgi:protein-S-isoprenylcysteine O-methyltransferase Ste14